MWLNGCVYGYLQLVPIERNRESEREEIAIAAQFSIIHMHNDNEHCELL